MRRKPWILALLFALLVGCTAGQSNTLVPPSSTPAPHTATPTPEPAPSPTPTFAPIEWTLLQDVENLALHRSWIVEGGTIVDDRLEMQAQGNYFTVVNAEGPYLVLDGDWGVSATVEVAAGDAGAFLLFGTLPQGAWWQGIRRLDLSWNGRALEVLYWDGTAQSPSLTKSFAAGGTSGAVQLQVRSTQGQLLLLVDGAPVGQMDDPGLTPEGRVYLGTNVPPNAKLIVHEIAVEAARGQEGAVQVVSPVTTVYVPSSPSLRELAAARSLLIGAAVNHGALRGEAAYAQALAHEFNVVTPENAMKFGPIHPAPDRYAFGNGDAIVAFAEEHDMQVHGHVLVWHQQLPEWVEKGEWTREELLDILHDHITTVVGHYRGRVQVWDVVNEAVDGTRLRDTVWLRVIGPEYIDLAFQWAHEADPEAQLFYNDYACEELCAKSDAIYDMIQGMLERGVPIHGVGIQAHLNIAAPPNAESFGKNIQRFNDLGLDVQITELDIRISGEPSKQQLAKQATIYRELLDTCLTAEQCSAFITWGFTDRYSWIPSFSPGWGSALILDEAYRPKPAYEAIREALATP